MNPSRFIVGYKDDEDAKVRYFGPFVSESVADFFTAALPEPLEGGWVRTVALQPFGPQEGRTVNQLILRERKQPPVPANVRSRPHH